MKTIFLFLSLLLLSACSENTIVQPPLEEPISTHIQQDSVIQIPVSINTKEIEKAIVDEIENPLSSGITQKLTADIFATEKISREEYIEALKKQTHSEYYKEKYENVKKNFANIIPETFELFVDPTEATYKHTSKDITDFVDRTFKAGMWVRHEIYLKDLQILFEGSTVKIYTSYTIEVAVDYEQSLFPSSNPTKKQGLVTGSIDANIQLMGKVFINDKAQLRIEAFEDATKIKFTKIQFPYTLNVLNILKLTQTEDFLTKRILEEPINKRIFSEVQKHIAKKQVDIQLAQKIQALVYQNATPFFVSKDLWLVPKANQISISQIDGKGGTCSNSLSINVGIIAKPQLVTSESEPIVNPAKSIPIVCEDVEPKIYLYPSVEIQYDFIATTIQEQLQSFIDKKHKDAKYSIGEVTLYPSNSKLVVAIDLLKKESDEKVVTFYLWGTPKLDAEHNYVKLENLDFTMESKNYLLQAANWILDEKIRNLIEKYTYFYYEKELLDLSNKLSNLQYIADKKIIEGNIELIEIESIFTSKKSLIIHTVATGQLSYEMKLLNLEVD